MNQRKRSIAITGANGFIGSAVVERFARSDWRVVALSRTPPKNMHANAVWRPYALEGAVDATTLEGADALVHAAYVDERAGDVAINVDGAARLLAAARAAGIPRRVFISSVAAGANAFSGYAQQKAAIEKLFQSEGDAVVRPGLVLGNGGLFARMARQLRKSPFVPLIGGGGQPLQTVSIDDLVDALVHIVEAGGHGTFTLAQAEPVTYQKFYRDLAAALGSKVVFVPVPFWVAEAAVRIAGKLHVPLPVGRDNLVGLRSMVAQESSADWKRLGLEPRPYGQGILLAVSERELRIE